MKTTKTTFTIVSALASVILLTSCGSNTNKTQETKASSTKNQVTMTYDQQRSQENTMSVLWYQKAAETKALYLQGYKSLLTARKRSFKLLLISLIPSSWIWTKLF